MQFYMCLSFAEVPQRVDTASCIKVGSKQSVKQGGVPRHQAVGCIPGQFHQQLGPLVLWQWPRKPRVQ